MLTGKHIVDIISVSANVCANASIISQDKNTKRGGRESQEDIAYLFELYLKDPDPPQYVDGYAKTVDKAHGRIKIVLNLLCKE